MALHLLANELVYKVILMDRDPLVAHFWHAVFFDTTWLAEAIKHVEVTLDNWDHFRALAPNTPREAALKGLFLNRTSFSGILEKQAGPLGGRAQTSRYTIDCRFPKNELIRRIEEIAGFADRISGVWCCSWEEGVQRIRELQQAGELPTDNVFFYLDPPFFKKAEKLYRFTFTDADHAALRDFLIQIEDKWILSYDSADDVKRLYGRAVQNGTNQHHVELVYTTGRSGRVPSQEVILSNFEHLPQKDKFWQVASGLQQQEE